MTVESLPQPRLTVVQRQRRQRILDTAIALAGEGGYEAVQMREVAARADVALGTLYRYFSSKEHLLVSAMAEQVSGLRRRLGEKPPRGAEPADRVMDVLRRSTRALMRQPDVTAAMLKSLISSGGDVAAPMEPIGEQMTAIVVGAIDRGDPEADRKVAEVIQHVWLAALLWWVAGLAPASNVEEKLTITVDLLLR